MALKRKLSKISASSLEDAISPRSKYFPVPQAPRRILAEGERTHKHHRIAHQPWNGEHWSDGALTPPAPEELVSSTISPKDSAGVVRNVSYRRRLRSGSIARTYQPNMLSPTMVDIPEFKVPKSAVERQDLGPMLAEWGTSTESELLSTEESSLPSSDRPWASAVEPVHFKPSFDFRPKSLAQIASLNHESEDEVVGGHAHRDGLLPDKPIVMSVDKTDKIVLGFTHLILPQDHPIKLELCSGRSDKGILTVGTLEPSAAFVGATYLKITPRLNKLGVDAGSQQLKRHRTPLDSGTKVRVRFNRSYQKPPNVVLWLNKLDMDRDGDWQFDIYAEHMSAKGFQLCIQPSTETKLFSVGVSWIAYPADSKEIRSGVLSAYSTPETQNIGQRVRHKRSIGKDTGCFEQNHVFFAMTSFRFPKAHGREQSNVISEVTNTDWKSELSLSLTGGGSHSNGIVSGEYISF